MDVILYDALNCPVYRTSELGMIIPNDNVAAVFEVKFQLTTTLLDSAFQKIHEAKNLQKTPIQNPHPEGQQIATHGVIFAFSSDLTDEVIVDRWHKKLDRTNPLHHSCSMVVILDRGIFVTVIDIPGEGAAPVDFQGISPAPLGTKVGIGCFPYGDRTLDVMLRLLLGHLTFFRHRIDHPGFDFATLGAVRTKWLGEYDGPQHVIYVMQ